MAREHGDVPHPLAKRRRPDRHHVEPIEEILSETTLRHFRPQIPVGHCDDADVDAHGTAGADAHDLALLEAAQ